MDPKYFLILAAIIILGWFAFGIIYNLRRGEAVLHWMQSGLPKVGERTTLRWLGSSVAELKIARAKGPFRQLDTLLVMAPRDVPWLWLISGLQGRRDTLIFRAQLGSPPHLDMELADPASWTGRMAIAKASQLGWQSQPYQEYQLMAPAGRLSLAAETIQSLSPFAEQLTRHYRLFSLHQASPHLELHLPFPDLRKEDAAQFFGALQKLAQVIGEKP
jgi:hypothetical protein